MNQRTDRHHVRRIAQSHANPSSEEPVAFLVNPDIPKGEQAVLYTLNSLGVLLFDSLESGSSSGKRAFNGINDSLSHPLFVWLALSLTSERSTLPPSHVIRILALCAESREIAMSGSHSKSWGSAISIDQWQKTPQMSKEAFRRCVGDLCEQGLLTTVKLMAGKHTVLSPDHSSDDFAGLRAFQMEKADEALDLCRHWCSFGVGDFMKCMSRGELPPRVEKVDERLQAALSMYETFSRFVITLSKICMPRDLRTRLESDYGYETLEDAQSEAVKTVTERFKAARNAWISQQKRKAIQDEEVRRAALEEAAQIAAARQLRDEENAERQREQKAQRLREFHATFQRAELPHETISLLQKLEESTTIPQSKRRAAGECAARFRQIFDSMREHLLDLRGDDTKSLGDEHMRKLVGLLFSNRTVALLAEAFEIDPKAHLAVPTTTADDKPAYELLKLYQESPAARRVILTSLNTYDGALLLAGLLVSPEDVKTYARALFKPAVFDKEGWGWKGRDVKLTRFRDDLVRKLVANLDTMTVKRNVGVLSGYDPATEASTSSTQEAPLEDWLLQAIDREGFVVWSKGSSIIFAPKDDYRLFFSVNRPKREADMEKFRREYQAEVAKFLKRQEVNKLVHELTEQCGFVLNENQSSGISGSQVILRHEWYEIECPLPLEREHWWKYLERARQEWGEAQMILDGLLRDAQEYGFSLRSAGDDTFLTHTELGETKIAEGEFVPKKSFEVIRNLITGSEEYKRQAAQRQERLQARRQRTEQRTEEVVPQAGDKVIVLDTSTLIALAVPQSTCEGGVWLDLLSPLVQLPNVRIMLPARILDFEFCGMIFPYDELEPIEVDRRPQVAVEAARRLFKLASRMQLQPNGEVPKVRDPHTTMKRLIIVETPDDTEFYAGVKDILQLSDGDSVKRIRELRDKIYKRGVGEAGIMSMIERAPFTNHFTVVTDDMAWSRHHLPSVVGESKPVTSCLTGDLLAAIFAHRDDGPFQDFSWGGVACLGDVITDIRNGTLRADGSYQRIFETPASWKSRSGRPASNVQSISEILREGIAAWNQRQQGQTPE